MQNQLADFIQQARLKKIADEEIVKALLEQGWKLDQIQSNMNTVPTSLNGLVPPNPSLVAVSNLGMWDSFQHILLFISLYVMSTSIALILHYLVDRWMPGFNKITSSYGYANSYSTTLFAGYSAGLLVSFPFFAFFFLETNKRKKRFPEIINLHSRKVLIYSTLVITFLVMVCHLIYIVFQFLNGNVTLNALLHFMVTLSVSGSIFGYYIYEIRHDRKISP